jgi:hypothetical protein
LDRQIKLSTGISPCFVPLQTSKPPQNVPQCAKKLILAFEETQGILKGQMRDMEIDREILLPWGRHIAAIASE